MVYFVGHVIKHKNIWIPLTNIPVDVVDLSQDLSCRNLNPLSPSMQILYQPHNRMIPLTGTIVKTTYIKIFQRRFRSILSKRREKMKFKNLVKREIGL